MPLWTNSTCPPDLSGLRNSDGCHDEEPIVPNTLSHVRHVNFNLKPAIVDLSTQNTKRKISTFTDEIGKLSPFSSMKYVISSSREN